MLGQVLPKMNSRMLPYYLNDQTEYTHHTLLPYLKRCLKSEYGNKVRVNFLLWLLK